MRESADQRIPVGRWVPPRSRIEERQRVIRDLRVGYLIIPKAAVKQRLRDVVKRYFRGADLFIHEDETRGRADLVNDLVRVLERASEPYNAADQGEHRG